MVAVLARVHENFLNSTIGMVEIMLFNRPKDRAHLDELGGGISHDVHGLHRRDPINAKASLTPEATPSMWSSIISG